jgi:hypothetical protein
MPVKRDNIASDGALIKHSAGLGRPHHFSC